MQKKQLVFVISLMCGMLNAGKGQQLRVDVTNLLNLERNGETITVSWSEVKRRLPNVDPASVYVTYFTPREDKQKVNLFLQTVDTDGNGDVDELVFLDNFAPQETKSYVIRMAKRELAEGPVWTDARFMLPRQDLAWENDRVAFRMYGPALAAEVDNGIDVWCKRTGSLVIEKWYKDDESKTRSYHEDHGEGADFFSVGRTLGGGGSALWSGDSLIQPGVFESYKILATGPLRAMFELTFKPVIYNGKPIREVKRITLDAGQHLNKIDVTFIGEAQELMFAAGLVKRNGTSTTTNKANQWVSLYGLTTQQEVNGSLGTGAILPGTAFREIREDATHVFIIAAATSGKSVTYYSGAGWTRSGYFKNKDEWEQYLNTFSAKQKSPLVIRMVEMKE